MDMDKVASLGVTISSVFKGLYDYYQMVKKAPAKSQQLHEELYAISNISLNLKKSMMVSKFPSQRTKNFISTETLAQFEDMLHEMERKIALPEGQVTLERLKWPFTLKENLEYIARIERFKTTLNLSLSVHQSQQIADIPEILQTAQDIKARTEQINKNTVEITAAYQEEQYLKTLDWIYTGSFEARHRDISAHRAGLGDWFLNHETVE